MIKIFDNTMEMRYGEEWKYQNSPWISFSTQAATNRLKTLRSLVDKKMETYKKQQGILIPHYTNEPDRELPYSFWLGADGEREKQIGWTGKMIVSNPTLDKVDIRKKLND